MDTPRYVLAKRDSFTETSLKGIYIYVLCFNGTGGRDVPFYVGQAENLVKRFASHEFVIWHHAKFEEPVKIHIAGEVEPKEATLAEQDLISRLIRQNFILANSTILDKKARIQNLNRLVLKESKRAEVLDYLASPDTPYYVPDLFEDWQEQWIHKTSIGNLVETNELRFQLGRLPALMRVALTAKELEVHQKLVNGYNFQTACSVLSLTDAIVSELDNLQDIWSIHFELEDRVRQGNRIYLRAASIRAALGAAHVVNPNVMASPIGEISVGDQWTPHPSLMIEEKEKAELLKQLRSTRNRLGKLNWERGDEVKIEKLNLLKSHQEEALSELQSKIEKKYLRWKDQVLLF